jgi:hypothetical protein
MKYLTVNITKPIIYIHIYANNTTFLKANNNLNKLRDIPCSWSRNQHNKDVNFPVYIHVQNNSYQKPTKFLDKYRQDNSKI